MSKKTQDDVNGDGTVDSTHTDVTVLNADGSTTQTVTDFYTNGSLKDRNVETISADGLSTTKQWDTTGSGSFDQTATDIAAINADGSKIETLSAYDTNGSLISRSVITTSADGRTEETRSDNNGDGTIDQSRTVTVIQNADGSSTKTVTDFGAGGTVKDQSITTTSYDGRTITTTRDTNGDGIIDQTETTTSLVDGSTVSVVDDFLENGRAEG